MSAQHTPGPWKQDTLGGTTVWSSEGKSAVAVCQGFERADNIANARLIAAAPDLLAALIELNRLVNTGDVEWGNAHNDMVDAVHASEAAIAKAKGQQ